MEFVAQGEVAPVRREMEDAGSSTRTARRLLVLLSFFFLLGTSFRAGWIHLDTDFPNYYTAAVLVRKGQPLRKYYDWTWFVRQMNYAGIERQIGGYTPQTPVTMLPFVPLSRFAPLTAKRIWLTLNLILLVLTSWLLSRVTRFSVESIWLLAFCGFVSLRSNFMYGQYYIFLLFLLTLVYYFLWRGQPIAAGGIAGIAFALKLYAGPLLLYFIAKRNRRAAYTMLLVAACLAVVSVMLFGWTDIKFYATQIFRRSLDGGSSDPYDPGDSTISTLLRKLFVSEPELNPHPWFNAPWLFFFLKAFVNLSILAFTTLAVAFRRGSDLPRDFALFVIVTLLLSSSVVSYTYILLLLPVALLLDISAPAEKLCLLFLYLLLTSPVRPLWLFPKVWLLLALFWFVGRPYWKMLQAKPASVVAVLVFVLALLDAGRHMQGYLEEPGRRFGRVGVREGAALSAFPTVLPMGIVYESIGADRYVLRWLHDNKDEELLFNGHALRPLALTPPGTLVFELVAKGVSTMMQLDLETRMARPSSLAVRDEAPPEVLSPDGKWVAFTSTQNGPEQIWLRSVAEGRKERLTGGDCNSSSPVWELDSKAIIFASDCDRAYGLPALYRAPIRSAH
jgi:Glycosyltransferase family 87/WD40-like Beta Propeller Repeat